jgi:hypothetical protein
MVVLVPKPGSQASVQREAEAVKPAVFMVSLRCPRNGQANETLPGVSALSHIATGCLEQATGKADKVVFASPDTGQQGGVTLVVAA